jgi:hypothetical protein
MPAVTTPQRLEMPLNPPWPDVPPLRDHELARAIDVPSRLRWIGEMTASRGLLDESPGDATAHADIRRRIEVRERESRLFLGVVGEFSSGKSTLINALVRERLLRSDVLQGTTAAITLIGFGEQVSVAVRRRGKHPVVRAVLAVGAGVKALVGMFRAPVPPPSKRDLLDLLHRATTDEEFAKDVVQVDVTLPSSSLSDGLVVIDTPGMNAVNPRHGDVTGAALRELCDAVLVTVPADAAGSQTLFQYLATHAGEILHRCVFIVTKFDLLRRERDREAVLEHLRLRLASQLGVANPIVLAAAPEFVVASLPSERTTTDGPAGNEDCESVYGQDETQRWSTHFVHMESHLRDILKTKRLQAQADDVAKLLEQLYRKVTSAIERRIAEYTRRHAALERLVIPDIEAFIAPRRDAHVSSATREIEKIAIEIVNDVDAYCLAVFRSVSSAIENASDRGALRKAMESIVPATISAGEVQVRRRLEKGADQIHRVAMRELKSFHKGFQEQYRSLATLGGVLPVDGSSAGAAVAQFTADSKAISTDLGTDMGREASESVQRVLGGGAAGAVIGTFLLPGIGTVIGGLLGSLLGSMFGPSLAELKAQCAQAILKNLSETLPGAVKAAAEAVTEIAEYSVNRLSTEIDSYAPRYQGLVVEMRKRDAAECQQLERQRAAADADLAAVGEHQASLRSIRERLRLM